MSAAPRVPTRDDFWVGDVALVDVAAHMAAAVAVLAAFVAARLGLPSGVAPVVMFGGVGATGAVRLALAWVLTECDVRANRGVRRAPGPMAGPLVAALFGTTTYLLWRTVAIGGAARWLLIALIAPFALVAGVSLNAFLLVR